jgi:glyoxylase-like metal-dependent hydrolase (beta-lactamase superfamily II)
MPAVTPRRASPRLPASVRVVVRDWLNSNQVVLRGSRENAVIDSGYSACAGETLERLRRPDALATARLDRLVNTHCHSDHVGGNRLLRGVYGCRVSIPEGHARLVNDWDARALWLDYADQYLEPFAYDDTIAPSETLRLGDLDWQAIAVPGHDMGALVFYCPDERLLVSGDALWERGFGVIPPEAGEPVRLKATRRALETLAALDLDTVIPGHGRPFAESGAALEFAFRKLEAFERDPLRTARHFLKVMLTFSLLEKGRMALNLLPAYFEQVDAYREVNAEFFRLPAAALAEQLVGELEQTAAVTRREGFLFPAGARLR